MAARPLSLTYIRLGSLSPPAAFPAPHPQPAAPSRPPPAEIARRAAICRGCPLVIDVGGDLRCASVRCPCGAKKSYAILPRCPEGMW
jgi:hypothetical protein